MVPKPGQMAVPGRVELNVRPGGASEAALVRAARRGDGEAVGELFRRHWPAAYRAAYLVVGDRAAAEDIAQEAFLRAVGALDRFDRRRPLGPWLHRIAVNRAIDWTRARALRPEAPAGEHPAADAPHAEGISRELMAALGVAVRRAPRGRRAPLPARVHAGRDRGDARPPARHRELAAAPRARRPANASVESDRDAAR